MESLANRARETFVLWGRRSDRISSASLDILDSVAVNYCRDFKVPVFFYGTNCFSRSDLKVVLAVAKMFISSISSVLIKIKCVQMIIFLFALDFCCLCEGIGLPERHIKVSTSGRAASVAQNACTGSRFEFPSLPCLLPFFFL